MPSGFTSAPASPAPTAPPKRLSTILACLRQTTKRQIVVMGEVGEVGGPAIRHVHANLPLWNRRTIRILRYPREKRMQTSRVFPAFLLISVASLASAQITSVIQERFVQTQADVSSGQSAGDFDEASTFGPFLSNLSSSVTGPNGAGATATAGQNSAFTAAVVTGTLTAGGAVQTGTTFITGESNSQSSLLYIFNLAQAAPIEFTANGSLSYVGRNPDGEPSDLYGAARVRLIDAITMDLIAGFQLFSDPGTDSAAFSAMLPAGQYAILAYAQLHAFSADLVGPPARSGSGIANVSFSLSVPAPAAPALLGIGLLAISRRRRANA